MNMSVIFQQLQTIVQTESEELNAKWFVTIDASQVKRDLGINWQDLPIVHRWKNLLQGTSEGLEADLTCWLAPLTEETLKLTIDLSKSSPFCCTWLQSSWSTNEIAAYWQKSSNPCLPDGHHGLLRFYDSCILGSLQTVLSPEQWQTLTAPLIQWLYIDRIGRLANINVPAQKFHHNGKLTLNKSQLKLLQQAGKTDSIIFHMQANEHLPEDHVPFDAHRQISTALALLNKHNITKPQDQYLFSALTLAWPLPHFATPELEQALSDFKQDEADLSLIIEQHAPDNFN